MVVPLSIGEHDLSFTLETFERIFLVDTRLGRYWRWVGIEGPTTNKVSTCRPTLPQSPRGAPVLPPG